MCIKLKFDMIKNTIYVLFLSVMMSTGCLNSHPVSTDEYMSYIEDPANGVTVASRLENFEFGLLYKPLDYIIGLEFRNGVISLDSMSSRKKQLEGFQYYTLRIRSNQDSEFIRTGLSSENEYYQRLEYMVSNAQDDIVLVEGRDTIPCAIYHFERNYGLSPNTNIVLAFAEGDQNSRKDKVLIYDDKILGLGRIELRILNKNIRRIPQMII